MWKVKHVRVFGPVPERVDQMEKNNPCAQVITGLGFIFISFIFMISLSYLYIAPLAQDVCLKKEVIK